MTRVDYYSAEVKYTGSFEDYDIEDWKAKALAKAHRGGDCFDETKEETDEFAKLIHGRYFVEDAYPCNKIAVVTWAYIEEKEDDEE